MAGWLEWWNTTDLEPNVSSKNEWENIFNGSSYARALEDPVCLQLWLTPEDAANWSFYQWMYEPNEWYTIFKKREKTLINAASETWEILNKWIRWTHHGAPILDESA